MEYRIFNHMVAKHQWEKKIRKLTNVSEKKWDI